MSPQHSSLAYAELDNEAEMFQNQGHMPALQLMERAKAEITAMEDIVEFGGTITVSF